MNITKEQERLEKEIADSLQNKKNVLVSNTGFSKFESLPNTIERHFGGEDSENGECYYAILIKTDHELSFDDSYIAMYSKRTKHGFSYRDYLFRVTSTTAEGALNDLVCVYNFLVKKGIVRERVWQSKHKCLRIGLKELNKLN